MEQLFSNPYFVTGIPLLLFGVALIVLVLLYKEIKRKPELDFLKPYIFQAIVAAYKVSETNADKFGARLDGEDKAVVAKLAYTHLPQIHALVTEEQFMLLVEPMLAEATSLYRRKQDALEQAFFEWQEAENTAVRPKNLPNAVQ
jgi:hypothetical protein